MKRERLSRNESQREDSTPPKTTRGRAEKAFIGRIIRAGIFQINVVIPKMASGKGRQHQYKERRFTKSREKARSREEGGTTISSKRVDCPQEDEWGRVEGGGAKIRNGLVLKGKREFSGNGAG